MTGWRSFSVARSSASHSPASDCSKASLSPSRTARGLEWSGRTAPARAPSSGFSRASSRRTPGVSTSAGAPASSRSPRLRFSLTRPRWKPRSPGPRRRGERPGRSEQARRPGPRPMWISESVSRGRHPLRRLAEAPGDRLRPGPHPGPSAPR